MTVFYERTVALDRKAHRSLKIKIRPDHYAFARGANAIPLAASEFGAAGREYPILFVGDGSGAFHAVALLGLEDGCNLFVDEAGRWRDESYIPAFARRYPFVLATTDDPDRFTVCFDEAYAGFNKRRGTGLFKGDDESSYLKRMIEFMQTYRRDMLATSRMLTQLNEFGLLVSQALTVTHGGKNHHIGDFLVVDDGRLERLENERVVELFRSGVLRLVEQHRGSLANVRRLMRLRDAREVMRKQVSRKES